VRGKVAVDPLSDLFLNPLSEAQYRVLEFDGFMAAQARCKRRRAGLVISQDGTTTVTPNGGCTRNFWYADEVRQHEGIDN
jgi:hypothetical protein